MLKDLLNRLEEAEFFNKKNYYENLRKEVGSKCVYYDIPIFSTRLTTIHCSLEAFRGLYGIIPKPAIQPGTGKTASGTLQSAGCTPN